VGIRAVAFDIGGVLEIVDPAEQFLERWRQRLGLSVVDMRQLLWPLTRADPGNQAKTGGITEAEYRQRCTTILGLAGELADEFMAGFWDWYCGQLDADLVSYAAGLRPRCGTGILSNSVSGARRREQARFGFEQLVDVIVYSDEAGLAKPDPRIYALLCDELGVEPGELVFLDDRAANVEAARQLGIHGVLHVSTPESIATIDALLGPSEVTGAAGQAGFS
jgi:epoxide hydrolase-like predicted phosphatase